MRGKLGSVGLATALVALITGVAMSAGEHVWITAEADSDGGHHSYFLHRDDATEFDLADLADGETRVFGAGDRQVTVTRRGDEARLTRPAGEDEQGLSILCLLSSDTCKILTFEDDPENAMIIIEKRRECVDGADDCDADVLALSGLGEGHARVIVRKTVECDDDGDCTESEDVFEHGPHHGHGVLRVEAVDGKHGEVLVLSEDGPVGHHVMLVEDGDKVRLRCPEGDTTMRVDRDEADEVFLCPKHSVPLEKQERHHKIRTITLPQVPREDD